MKLAGSAVLVTGGSRGLGAALGRELARRGARVVLAARGGRGLDAVVAGILAAGGVAHALVADVDLVLQGLARAESAGYLGHEFGDAMLVLPA